MDLPDFGVLLGLANGWDLEELSDEEPDLEAPPSPTLSPQTDPSSPKKKGIHHTVGARIQALTIFECKGNPPLTLEEILSKTGISKSSVYRIRIKAISRGWQPDSILETWHVDDAPRSGRPKIGTGTALKIIEVVTKNSTTRGRSCERVAQEVRDTPGFRPVSASTVYRVLQDNGYGVFKRTVSLV